MKKYIISICIFFLLNACNHPDLDIQFNKESDIVIPAEGGAYYFEVDKQHKISVPFFYNGIFKLFFSKVCKLGIDKA